MSAYKLGKRPARPQAVTLTFGAVFNMTALPTPPAVFGHTAIKLPWGMLANDRYGDCVFAGAAHETMVWTHERGPAAPFHAEGVLSDYAAVTGFSPSNPDSDQGTDASEAAAYRRKIGVIDAAGTRHKVFAYSALKPGNVSDAAVACYLLGAVGVGLNLPDTAMDQFDARQPWSVMSKAKSEGGHYVPLVGRNSHGNLLIVTWGRLHEMTPAFFAAYCDEALAYISSEILDSSWITPEQFARDDLVKFIAALAA